MTTTEHLARIRAKCVELLDIASKRTTGKWTSSGNWVGRNNAGVATCCHYAHDSDARFIAACAGPAEAGWRATIAAIGHLLDSKKARTLLYHEEQLAESIIAAWPEELL